MVTGPVAVDRDALLAILDGVMDPEVPVLSVRELGIVRDVDVDHAGAITVTVTPTYSGCPAIQVIEQDIRAALVAAGHSDVRVRTVYAPAWTSDWIAPAAREKLKAYGIAPPSGRAAVSSGPIRLSLSVRCPRCGSLDTHEVSRFGSTSCKSLFECRACLEPFDHFKVH